jgi:outer membrane protein TolC
MKKIGLIVLMTVLLLFLTSAFAAGEDKPAQKEVFTLEECLKMGFQNNTQLLLADSNIKMYGKEVQSAFSGFMPTISYNINKYAPYNYDSGYSATSYDYNYFVKEITFNQLLLGGAVSLNYVNAKLNLATAIEDKRRTEQGLAYQIRAAFYDMWVKQQNLLTASVSENDMKKHYQLVNIMYKAGASNKLELYEAQGQWEEQKVATMEAKNELAQARLVLANLMNIDRFLEFEVNYILSQFEPDTDNNDSIKTIVEEAYKDRPEMHKAKITIEIAKNNLKIQKVKLLPTLSLTYDNQLDSEEINDTKGIKTWYVIFTLSGVIFDGFNNLAEQGVAKQNLESARLQEDIQRDQIFTEVIQSLQSLKQSYDLIGSTNLNVRFMQERANLTRLQYNNGKADTTDIINAQVSLDKALNQYYQQVMNYLTAKAKLDYALGNGE